MGNFLGGNPSLVMFPSPFTSFMFLFFYFLLALSLFLNKFSYLILFFFVLVMIFRFLEVLKLVLRQEKLDDLT